jgi:hypothetical protein
MYSANQKVAILPVASVAVAGVSVTAALGSLLGSGKQRDHTVTFDMSS